MSFVINGEKIDVHLIIEEIERLRPDYLRVFHNQTPDEQEAQLREWARENMLEKILLRQAAEKDTRPIPVDEIEAAYRRLMEKERGADHLTEKDRNDIRREIEQQLRIERFNEGITSDAGEPAEPEIRDYYEAHLEEFLQPERIHAAHIVKHPDADTSLEDARRFMMEILARLEAGESFETLADKVSDCPGSGGDLGWFPRGQMVERFDEAVFGMEPGQVSGIFQTEFGYHIVKVYEKQVSAKAPFEESREGLIERLAVERKNDLLESYVDQLKQDAQIQFDVDESLQLMFDRNRAAWDRKRYPKILSSVLIKPSGPDCNMACKYCFYLEKEANFPESKVHRMSDAVLAEMIRQVMIQSGEEVSIGWQGGEPTLMGLEFFEKAVALQKKYGQNQIVGNGFQTNGLLIDTAWAQFFKAHHFLVGLSLDGPEHIHDHYRKDKGGKGTWERVNKSAELLVKTGVSVNALSVVNDYSVQYPDEIYRFFKSLGLNYMQFIPCVETDPADPRKAAPFSVTPEAYGRFLCSLFDLWQGDFVNNAPTVSVRFFDAVFHQYAGQRPPECTLYEECGIYVVVEHNGDVYACDFFVEPEWKLGNVMPDRLVDLLNSDRQNTFGRQKSTLPQDCMDCRWLQICRGGCTKDRVRDSGDRQRSHFCGAYKMFFEYADARFKAMADYWKQMRTQEDMKQKTRLAVQQKEMRVNRNAPCPCGSGKKFKKCCGMMS